VAGVVPEFVETITHGALHANGCVTVIVKGNAVVPVLFNPRDCEAGAAPPIV
jgi:hypothetical protein